MGKSLRLYFSHCQNDNCIFEYKHKPNVLFHKHGKVKFIFFDQEPAPALSPATAQTHAPAHTPALEPAPAPEPQTPTLTPAPAPAPAPAPEPQAPTLTPAPAPAPSPAPTPPSTPVLAPASTPTLASAVCYTYPEQWVPAVSGLYQFSVEARYRSGKHQHMPPVINLRVVSLQTTYICVIGLKLEGVRDLHMIIIVIKLFLVNGAKYNLVGSSLLPQIAVIVLLHK